MRHVLLVGNTAWGMFNFRQGVIKTLVDSGYKVTVMAPADNKFDKKIEQLGAYFENIHIESKGKNIWVDIKLIRSLKKKFSLIRPDYIFFYTIKPNIYGSLVATFLKIPHVAIITGLGYTFLHKNFVNVFVRWLYKYSLKNTKQVWFLNEEDKDYFVQNKLVGKNRGFVIDGEGINTNEFKSSGAFPANVSFILIARMLWDKGIGEFVRAARILKAKYPEVNFKLLGFLGVENPQAISSFQIDIWQQEGIVEYLGSTDNVKAFIENSTCIVLPSYREGIPLTLLEGASMERPVIATDVAGCKKTVEDGKTGYICKVKDVTSLCNAMEKIILMSPSERKRMGRNGRDKMIREFDEKLVIGYYLNTLNNFGL